MKIVCISKETNEHRHVQNRDVLKRRLKAYYIDVELALDMLIQGETLTTPFSKYRMDGDWRHVACTEVAK